VQWWRRDLFAGHGCAGAGDHTVAASCSSECEAEIHDKLDRDGQLDLADIGLRLAKRAGASYADIGSAEIVTSSSRLTKSGSNDSMRSSPPLWLARSVKRQLGLALLSCEDNRRASSLEGLQKLE
jgi:hypothetical protein